MMSRAWLETLTLTFATADSPLDAMNIDSGISANLICNRYGAETLRNLRRLEKLRIDKYKKIAHLSFLKQCRDNNSCINTHLKDE